MARDYFSQFPKAKYLVPSSEVETNSGDPYLFNVPAVDIMVKFKVKDAILSNSSLFFPYRWRDYDRPETVANRYYGNPKFFWLVFFSNDAFDLNYDFALNPDNFRRYLFKKYEARYKATLSNPQLTSYLNMKENDQINAVFNYTTQIIHHWEIEGFVVDEDTYDELLPDAESSAIVTVYDYEEKANEDKRDIQLMDVQYLNNIVREFLDDMKAVKAGRS